MKKVFVVLMMLVCMLLTVPVCFAQEEPVVEAEAGELTYTEKEQMIRDVLDMVLVKGDDYFTGQSWWDVVKAFVVDNIGAIVAAVGGFASLIGFLLVIIRSLPQLRGYVNSLGNSCRAWFEEIGKRLEGMDAGFQRIDQRSSEVERLIQKQQMTIELLTDTLEDVIKLSGADEGKKELYLKKIEVAKVEIRENDHVA